MPLCASAATLTRRGCHQLTIYAHYGEHHRPEATTPTYRAQNCEGWVVVEWDCSTLIKNVSRYVNSCLDNKKDRKKNYHM